MLIIDSDLPELFNDISEEVRLFFGREPLTEQSKELPADQGSVLLIRHSVAQDGRTLRAECAFEGHTHTESALLPESGTLERKRILKRCVKSCVYRLLKECTGKEIPWGSLTGVRPSKLFRELCGESGEAEAESAFLHVYDVDPGKIRLLKQIYDVQKPVIDSVTPDAADVYVNIPFCVSKCLYCSFPSGIVQEGCGALDDYLDILERDIRFGAGILRDTHRTVRAVYIGGGTPTILSALQLSRLLTALRNAYPLGNVEFTVEAGRPDTVTREKLRVLKEGGVNRISVNPQTMRAETLEVIGRKHTPEQIRGVFSIARETGFGSINMDLIAGLPGETADDFLRSLREVLSLAPDNITVHSLALKRSSVLYQTDFLLNETDISEMIGRSTELLTGSGYLPYYLYRQKYMSGNLENIGYALPGKICVYNIDMMEETAQIMSHGACAVSKRLYGMENRIERVFNPKDIRTYAEKLDTVNAQKAVLFR